MARKPWADQGTSTARGYGYSWQKLRLRILDRDGHLCQACAAKGRVKPATEVHHRTPKAEGGTDDPDNLLSLCRACHLEADAANRGRRVRPPIGLDGWPVGDADR